MIRSYFGNKHVVLTGGSSGIGRSMAELLVEAGADLTLVARRAGPLEETRDALKSKGESSVRVLPLDVSDAQAVEDAVKKLIAEQPVDMLINNAGVAMPGRFLETAADEYRRQMDINYFGAVNMCRALVPHLIERGHGHVTNVGSLLSVMGLYGYSAYAASKFALQGFSECVRAELAPKNIRVSMLLPPDTDTPQHAAEMEHLPPETKALAGSVKMLTPEYVARYCLEGMAAGRFEMIPGFDGRMTVAAQRWVPSVVRWWCDRASGKVSSEPRSANA